MFAGFAIACSLTGCGGAPAPVPENSHNGAMFPLPGKAGYFEIRTDTPGSGRSGGGRTKGGASSIIVYFYQPDGKTELSPAPTDVTVRLGSGEQSSLVALAPHPFSGRNAASFSSSPGNYPRGLRGQLSAKVNGQTVEVPFLAR
jgi:hypothetical protein